jgi:hypothetical protein
VTQERSRGASFLQWNFEKETAMQTTFICPRTSTAIGFDLPADEEAMRVLWSQPLKINCPFCWAIHVTDYKGVYVAGVMSEFECIPADVRQARLH